VFAVPDDDFKHRFLDLCQVALCDWQEAENEFKVTCEPLKLRFLDLTQVSFLAVKKYKLCSLCLETT